MSKFGTAVWSALMCAMISTPALAQDVDTWLNAPAWELTYEMSFRGGDSGSSNSFHGPTSYTMSIDCGYSASLMLNMRNAGASLSMVLLSTRIDPHSADMQQAAMDLVMRTDVMANWMSAPPYDESASDDAQMKAIQEYMESSKGLGRLDYKMVVKGTNLTTEMGTKYNMVQTTTMKGTGVVIGPTQLTFEMDAAAKTYLLTLSNSFEDKSDSTVLKEVVTNFDWQGSAPTVERTTERLGLDIFATGFKIDDSTAMMGEVPLMQGTFDPSQGKITGERSFRGHYGATGSEAKGTLVFRWTLTPRT